MNKKKFWRRTRVLVMVVILVISTALFVACRPANGCREGAKKVTCNIIGDDCEKVTVRETAWKCVGGKWVEIATTDNIFPKGPPVGPVKACYVYVDVEQPFEQDVARYRLRHFMGGDQFDPDSWEDQDWDSGEEYIDVKKVTELPDPKTAKECDSVILVEETEEGKKHTFYHYEWVNEWVEAGMWVEKKEVEEK